ncbi:MAG: methyltransferase domain-containing protein [Planctomycetota bacterium]|nr:methyltransferase domain-containing protein [Planctomycetota bacterium]
MALRRLVPKPLRAALRRAWNRLRARRARRAFQAAGAEPAWLPPEELPRLHARYPAHPSLDPGAGARRKRLEERMEVLAGLLRAFAPPGREVLELGCGDGTLAGALAREGWRVCALDVDSAGFDREARAAGVRFLKADAARVPLREARVAFAYSYNAFEHLADPERALGELARVLAPGGRAYLHFAPLYFSPWGLHAYEYVRAPYVQVLFEPAALQAFARGLGEKPRIPYVNAWPAARFRALFRAPPGRLRPLFLYETMDAGAVELIERHPACFKAKGVPFEEFVSSGFEVLFEKPAAELDIRAP